MKKIIFLIIMLLLSVGAQAAEIKIGYVDLNKALNESREGKKAVQLLEEMVKSRQLVIDEKGNEIKKLEAEISKQSSILNPKAIEEKKEQRKKLMRDYQRMIKDSQDEVQKKQSDFMEEIIKKLRVIVEQIGKDEGYTVIFEKAESGILYVPDKVDVTEKVIEKYNEAEK